MRQATNFSPITRKAMTIDQKARLAILRLAAAFAATVVMSSVAAVQFHPESIMTLGGDAGMRMIENVVAHLARRAKEKAA
jgi:anthranilate/para-aminobenzoate synthase component II